MKKIILLFTLSVMFISSGQTQDIFKQDKNLYSTDMLLLSKPCSENSSIIITSAAYLKGKITITVTDDKKFNVIYYKKAKTSTKSNAIDYIDLITVHLSKKKNGFKLEMRAPNPPPWPEHESGIVAMELSLPRWCDIEIDALYFDVEADGPFRNFLVPSSLGRLTVNNVTEELELATSNRRLTVSNITGQVYLSTSNSALYATDINSPNKKIIMRNEGGDINVDNISGELNIRNKYGLIDIRDFKPSGFLNKIKGDNGPINISITEINSSQLMVSNRYEDIEISVPQKISVELSLAVEEDGKISVSNLPFKPELVQPNRLNLIVKEGSALINGSIRGKGNIYLRGQDEEE